MPVWVSNVPELIDFGFDFYPAKEAVFPREDAAGPPVTLVSADDFATKLGIEFPKDVDTALLFDSCFCFQDLASAFGGFGGLALLINFTVPNGGGPGKTVKWEAIFRNQEETLSTERNFGEGSESVPKTADTFFSPVTHEIYQSQIPFTMDEIDNVDFGDPFQVAISRLGSDIDDDYLDSAIFLSAELVFVPFAP